MYKINKNFIFNKQLFCMPRPTVSFSLFDLKTDAKIYD